MRERTLKYATGCYLVLSHLLLIGLGIFLYFKGGFSTDEFTTILAVITPASAGYTTSVIAFIISEARVIRKKSPRVNMVYVAFSFLMPTIMVVIVGLSLWFKANNQIFDNFEDFKRFLLLMESLFAGYAGMFVYSLFEKKPAAGTVQATED
jgi:hypothetical protein